jgi:hypothetical protein
MNFVSAVNTRRSVMFVALAIGLGTAPQAMAGGPPYLPTGRFAITAEGTEASCSGNNCVTLKIIEAGNVTRDAAGNACGTHTAVVNTVPPGAAPPTVVPAVTMVLKVKDYNQNTGTGDESLAEYSGGSCVGANFNSNGATQVTAGTLHFVVSDEGNTINSVITSLSIGGSLASGYSISFRERQQ